jgi:hypothetical protein
MKLTADQKRALYIAGGVAAIAILFYMWRSNQGLPPTAREVNPAPTFDNSPPGYTTWNVQPLTLPPSIANPPIMDQVAGCGCKSSNDGCFSSSPIDTGRGPVSLNQLLATYAQSNKDLAGLFAATLAPYAARPATIIEMTQPSYNPLYDFSLSAAQRTSEFYHGGGFANPAWPSTYLPGFG